MRGTNYTRQNTRQNINEDAEGIEDAEVAGNRRSGFLGMGRRFSCARLIPVGNAMDSVTKVHDVEVNQQTQSPATDFQI